MPAPAPSPSLATSAGARDGVISRRDLLAHDVSVATIRTRVRSGLWAPLLRGTYLVEPGHAPHRSWARSAVLVAPDAVLVGATAARLHGIEGVPRSGTVEMVSTRHVRTEPGRLRVSRRRVPQDHVIDLDGLPVTSVVRTLADLVPRLDRPDALAVLDSALRHGLVDPDGLCAAAALGVRDSRYAPTDGRTDARAGCGARARGASDLWGRADGRAESPLESRVRCRCLDDGLAPRALQEEIRDEHGHLLARTDMTFERRDPSLPPLVLEADGRGPHESPDALYRDRWRANTLVALGHPVVRCTWRDTLSRLAVPTMVRAAL